MSFIFVALLLLFGDMKQAFVPTYNGEVYTPPAPSPCALSPMSFQNAVMHMITNLVLRFALFTTRLVLNVYKVCV